MTLSFKHTTFKILFSLVLCTFLMNAKGQMYKKKSKVILNNGDSMVGWIRYTGWSGNPKSIEFFRDSAAKKGESFSVYDLQSFEIYGYRSYQRAYLTLPVNGEIQSDTKMDTIFLQVLVKGDKASLYAYKGSTWIFYLLDSTDTADAYIALQETDGGANEGFKRQLRTTATRLGRIDMFDKIIGSEYTRESLSEIVELMNGKQKNVVYSSEKTNKHYLRAFAGPGIGMTKLAISGTEDFLENIRFSNRITPSFTGGIDFSGSGDFEKSVLRLTVSFSSDYYDGSGPATTSSGDQVSYLIKQTNIEPEIGFLYHFTEAQKWRPYVGVSAGYAFAFYKENQMNQTLPEGTYKNYLAMESGWINAHVYVGLRVNRQLECSVSGLILGNFTEANQFSLTPRTYTFSMFYHFTK